MLPRLHLVTDDAVLAAADFTDRARAVLAAHGKRVALHLRGHGTVGAAFFRIARELVAAAEASGGSLLVNDRVDVALAAGADGVQLGRRSVPVMAARALLRADAWIGYSAHTEDEAAGAVAEGADFLVFGAVYPTASHPGRPAAGLERMRRATSAGAELIAIGGVTPGRVAELRAAGAYGVAVLGGVWGAADAEAAVGEYIEALEGSR